MAAFLEPPVLQGAGLLLLFLVAGRVAVSVADGLVRLRHGRAALEAERRRLFWQLDREREAWERRARSREAGWSGFRKFEVRRIEKENACGSIRSFTLAPHDRKPLPEFEPGQFLTFRLKIPGQPKEVVRCYSLSDWHHPEHYRVTVKRIEGGLASNFFHDRVRVGDLLDVRAPSGRFVVSLEEDDPVALVAGGVGVTPLLCMFRAIAERQPNREVHFLYAAHDGTEFVMREALARLALECPRARVVFCYSKPTGDDEAGMAAAGSLRAAHRAGLVDRELLRREIPGLGDKPLRCFVCGPPPMMDAVRGHLGALGVPEERIHMEAFGPKSVGAVRPPAFAGQPPAGASFQVTFARSGKRASWDGTHASLLAFAEANGVAIEAGCCAGDCHTCLTALREGKIDHLRPPPRQPDAGTCLACIAVPVSDLVLDA